MSSLAVTVPWWGTGVFTIVAGVVGAAVAGLIGWVRDRHADRLRESLERREIARNATADFISEFHAMVTAAMEAHGADKHILRPSKLRTKYSLLSITADDEIVGKADAARKAYHRFRDLVGTKNGAEWSAAGKECERVIQELIDTARTIGRASSGR